MSDRMMKQIESTLSGAVASFQKRHGGELPRGACLHEAVDNKTPYDVLDAKEQRERGVLLAGADNQGPTLFEELDQHEEMLSAESKEALLISLETHFWLLDFLFADGPHPGTVMRRLYAWVKKYRPEAIWDMGYRQLGKLFDESGGAQEWRVGALLDDYAKAKGHKGVKMPWQRTDEACESYSQSQKGNANRVGGKRAGKHKATKKK
jgi:hypothetical protein